VPTGRSPCYPVEPLPSNHEVVHTIQALDASVGEASDDEADKWWRWGWVCLAVSVVLIVVLAGTAIAFNPSDDVRAVISLASEAFLAVVTLVAAVRVAGSAAGFAREVGLESVTRTDLLNWLKGVGWQLLALVCFGAVVGAIDPHAINEASNTTGLRHAPVFAVVVIGIAAVLVAPVVEETQFRGLLLRGGMRRYGFLPAAALSSLVFGCLHGWQVHTPAGVTVLIARMVVFGFVQCVLVRRSGRLTSNVLIHASFNLLATIAAAT
jgi:membrane protease YdiL (CAAX protease family)